jgi:hypothetical protein
MAPRLIASSAKIHNPFRFMAQLYHRMVSVPRAAPALAAPEPAFASAGRNSASE